MEARGSLRAVANFPGTTSRWSSPPAELLIIPLSDEEQLLVTRIRAAAIHVAGGTRAKYLPRDDRHLIQKFHQAEKEHQASRGNHKDHLTLACFVVNYL